MKTKGDYKLALDTIRMVIHEWDPYGLLHGGAPPDEFDGEIASIARQVPRIRSGRDAAHVLSRTFSSSFEPQGFRPESCRDIGERLYRALVTKGLVE